MMRSKILFFESPRRRFGTSSSSSLSLLSFSPSSCSVSPLSSSTAVFLPRFKKHSSLATSSSIFSPSYFSCFSLPFSSTLQTSFRFCATTTTTTTTTSNSTKQQKEKEDDHEIEDLLSTRQGLSFIRTVERSLYRLCCYNSSSSSLCDDVDSQYLDRNSSSSTSLLPSPSNPQWVPLRLLGLVVPEDTAEQLKHFSGGWKQVIETCFCSSSSSEIRRDPATGSWSARTVAKNEHLVRLSSLVDGLILMKKNQQQNQQSMKINISQELIPILPQSLCSCIQQQYGGGNNNNFNSAVSSSSEIFESFLVSALADAKSNIPDACWQLKFSNNNNQNENSASCFLIPDFEAIKDNERIQIDEKDFDLFFKAQVTNQIPLPSSFSSSSSAFANNNNNKFVPPPAPIFEDGDFSSQNHQNGSSKIPQATKQIVWQAAMPEVIPEPITLSSATTSSLNNNNNNEQQQQISDKQQMEEHLSSALKIEDLIHYLPTFFIPIELALEQLEPLGYTQDHLEQYFAGLKSIQLIKRPPMSQFFQTTNSRKNNSIDNNEQQQQHHQSRSFIRVHSAGGHVDMTPVIDTNERFSQFEPKPSLSRPFLKLLQRPGSWVPLSDLLEMAGKEAEEALPFQGADSLMYFAQLQHIFVFSLDRGGMIARRPKQASLFSVTTPCPLFYNELCRLLLKIPRQNVRAVEAQVHPKALEQMQHCFPNWEAFASSHCEKFHFDSHTNDFMLAGHHRSEQIQKLSLDEQFEEAIKTKGRGAKHLKSLKRRIARERDPDNPLLDPERLAAALVDFLPPPEAVPTNTHHISLRALMFSLPDEIRDLLPSKGLMSFVKRFPNYFTSFDFRSANARHVMRAGLPLPHGALREDFSSEEIVALVVQDLQRRQGGRARVCDIVIRLPQSVRENQIKKQEHLVPLLSQYRDCFVFVSSGELIEVVLVKPPVLSCYGSEGEI